MTGRGMTLSDILQNIESGERGRPALATCKKTASRAARPRKPAKPKSVTRCRLSEDDVMLVKQLRVLGLSWREIQDKFDDRPRPPSLPALRDVWTGRRRSGLKDSRYDHSGR